MTKMTYRAVFPKPKPGTFAAEPRTLIRAGNAYGRNEEAPDPAQGLHGLMIVAEPDAWMINLADKSGMHIVDPGPSYDFHAQVFQVRGKPIPKAFAELEFGREVAFFKAHHAKEDGDALELELDGVRVRLGLNATTHNPRSIQIFTGDKLDLEFEYVAYETGLPFDAALFRPPPGIKLVEARPRK